MKKVVYYTMQPRVVGVDFSQCVTVTVPNQSLSLKTILQRFIKRQPLPVEMEGSYMAIEGVDLEKLVRADWIDRHEFLERYRRHTKSMEKVLADRKAKEDADALAKLVPPVVPRAVPQ